MRLIEPEDLLGRAERNERFENFAVKGAVRPRIQFSVRKGTRAALAELHVSFRVEPAFPRKYPDLFFPFFHVGTAFYHERTNAVRQ